MVRVCGESQADATNVMVEDGWVTEGEAGQMKRRRRWLRIAVRAQEEDLNQEAVL